MSRSPSPGSSIHGSHEHARREPSGPVQWAPRHNHGTVPPSETVGFFGLGPRTTAADIERYCHQFGDVRTVTLVTDRMTGGSKGMVFVDCGDVELARKIRENSQTLVMHDRQVRVDFSKSRAQRDKDRTSAPPPSHQSRDAPPAHYARRRSVSPPPQYRRSRSPRRQYDHGPSHDYPPRGYAPAPSSAPAPYYRERERYPSPPRHYGGSAYYRDREAPPPAHAAPYYRDREPAPAPFYRHERDVPPPPSTRPRSPPPRARPAY